MNQKYILLFNTNTQQMAEHLLYILVVNIILVLQTIHRFHNRFTQSRRRP